MVLGGHSLGGSITTAYATWDFNGTPGVKGLSGLVYDDGGSSPTPITRHEAEQSLDDLQAGLAVARVRRHPGAVRGPVRLGRLDPGADRPERAGARPVVSAAARQPEAAGAGDEPRPVGLRVRHPDLAPQRRSPFRLTSGASPRAATRAAGTRRATSPRSRATRGCSPDLGRGRRRRRLVSPDAPDDRLGGGRRGEPEPRPAGAAASTPIHGDEINVPIYAFGASRGRARSRRARALAQQSGLPASKLTLVNRQGTYAHNDPAGAFPGERLPEPPGAVPAEDRLTS